MFETTWLFTLSYDKWVIDLFPVSIDKKCYGKSLLGFLPLFASLAFSTTPLLGIGRALKNNQTGPYSRYFRMSTLS